MSNRQKLVVNGEIIYETDDKGVVVIDKRIESALEDGDIDFIDEYNLTSKEKKVVIDILKKYNKLNIGFPPDIAKDIANRVKEKERASIPQQVNVNENKNNVVEHTLTDNLTKGQEQLAINYSIPTEEETDNEIYDYSTDEDIDFTAEDDKDDENTVLSSITKYKKILNKINSKDIPNEIFKPNNFTKDLLKSINKPEEDYKEKPATKPNPPVIKPNPKPEPTLVSGTIDKNSEQYFFLEPRNIANVSNDDVSVNDNDWVTDVFMLGKKDLDNIIKDSMFWSTAELKITDTSLGGNISINSYPQYTRTADIRVMGKRTDREAVKIETISGNHGMGRYYSEKIDDNAVRCYMEFGVPEFNGIFNFITSSIDYKSAVIANSGRNPLAYEVGHLAGSIAFFAAFPIASLVYWLGSTIKDIVVGPGNFDFYYMKETMPKYWSIVNSLVMMMSTELGMLTPTFNTEKNSNVLGAPLKLTNEDLAYFRTFMPEAITENNEIDIFAVVTRTQRAINKYLKQQYNSIKTESTLENLQDLLRESRDNKIGEPTPYHKYWENVKKAYDGPLYREEKKTKPVNKDNDNGKSKIKKTSANPDGTYNKDEIPFVQNLKKYVDNFIDATKANMDGGAEHVVFNVEYLGSSTMSVSNEVGELELEGILKGVGGKARAVRFSGGESIMGSLNKVMGYVTDTLVGGLDGVTLNMTGKILSLLLGEANLRLPLRWMDSSISLPTHTFKMKLISPYGNPMSQLINIYIPLAAIMAGSLPLATGMSSYTSPFLCNLFVRGYQKINMGMITSLEINKGTTNLPFNKSWKPLGIDVSFTVTDFSKILALPVGQDLTSMSNIIYDDNNPLNRYIQALCGRDLHTTTFMVPKLKLRLSRVIDNVSIMTKPDYLGMKIGDTLRWAGKLSPFHTELGEYSSVY